MPADILAELGPIFLGSRLKRLGERMQAGAARVIVDAGLPVQPAHMPLLAALDREAMTVGQLAEAVGSSQPGVTRGVGQLVALGLVQSTTGTDQRRRMLSLTVDGRAAMARIKLRIWPRVGNAAAAMCENLAGGLLDQLAGLEAQLASEPLDVRVARLPGNGLHIRPFSDDLAAAFHDINAEWIGAMFRMEQADREVLLNPRAAIIDPGGAILFVEAAGLGPIGTCALRKTGDGCFELTKMGVLEAARGLKAGEFLLQATLARAEELGAEELYLLTNRDCRSAIHLYEKLGFEHDSDIMAKYGARYARCDVAMRYRGREEADLAA
jgi:DNA-binding MarR family transcriptional regulator/GNAT superfamily N-acetyltransferase